jgi:hypothetical protein
LVGKSVISSAARSLSDHLQRQHVLHRPEVVLITYCLQYSVIKHKTHQPFSCACCGCNQPLHG